MHIYFLVGRRGFSFIGIYYLSSMRVKDSIFPSVTMRHFLPILFIFFSVCGCGQSMVEKKGFDLMLKGILEEKVPFISVDSLAGLDSSEYVLLDARSREEFSVSHIPGAIWVGPEFDPDELPEIPEDRTVITYCAVGKRSEDYGAALDQHSDRTIMNLYGGIFEWANQKQPLVKEDSSTRKVHAYSKKAGVWVRNGEKVYEPEPGEGDPHDP